ncbi:hypothetical protein [Geodermatophilus ruber]|uniref:Uncharacterized protein n=1 Tax=Geodermatophilus ruber TaxID=504800 RepID=A0A1I4CEW0_9ACTN|nr:hypothetical protein [Geodermatophilus ruber]SFK79485.1 hypothetical protein SAMN04488085_103466 [Geodermatophilus ruber]
MTTSTGARTSESTILRDIEDVVAEILGEFAQKPDQSPLSIVKSVVKDVVKGALLGAFQGVIEAVTSLFRSGRVVVLEHMVGIIGQIERLLLQAIAAMARLLGRLGEGSGGPAATAESGEDEDRGRREDMEPARRERMGSS